MLAKEQFQSEVDIALIYGKGKVQHMRATISPKLPPLREPCFLKA